MKNEELSDALKNLQYLSGILDSEVFTESDLDDIVKEARKKIKRQRLKYDFITWKPVLWEKLKKIAGMNAFILLVVGTFAISNLEIYWPAPAIAMLTVGNVGMFTGLWISFKSWREYLRELEKEAREALQ
ncbi:hypothetical protein SP3_00048 [Bacillus phage fHSPT3]